MRASGSVRRIQNVFPVWRGPKRKWDFLASHSFRSGRRSTTGGLGGLRATVMSVVDYHDKRRLDRQGSTIEDRAKVGSASTGGAVAAAWRIGLCDGTKENCHAARSAGQSHHRSVRSHGRGGAPRDVG